MTTSDPDTRYHDLPPAAADLYRRLGALFATPVDTTLATAVTGLPRAETEDALAALTSAQLIDPTDADVNHSTLYQLRDHTHAATKFAENATADRAEVLRRALDHLLDTTSRAERRLTPTHRPLTRDYLYPPAEPVRFDTDEDALGWLRAHRHTLRSAVTAAEAAGIDSMVWQLTHALWPLLRADHDYPLWDTTHQVALGAARRCGSRVAEVEILGTWAVGLRSTGRHTDAIEVFDQVLRLARTYDDPRTEAQAFHELGATHLAAGRPQEAESLLLQARSRRTALMRQAEADGDADTERTFRRGVGITEVCLGEAQILQGRASEAVVTLTSARTTLLTVPDALDTARALARLGRAHALNGNHDQGEQYGQQAVAEFDRTGSGRWQARGRELLGQTLQEAGRPEDARRLYQEAVNRHTTPSDRADRARVLQRLGTLPTTEGDGNDSI
ncbi:tetratricopeptide repeat protein [Streptomyces sp. NPDC002514]|uniref:tetratricopeptide repeat protein n=1 Tax=Streptomyces sp. NPDC001270 TaxID=3364554 RepID=UPI003697FD5B